MFRGNHPAKVEENGRLKLPVPFKQLLDAANVTDLYVTSEDGKRAQIWPLGEWEKIEAQLAKHSTMNDSVMRYLDLTSYYAGSWRSGGDHGTSILAAEPNRPDPCQSKKGTTRNSDFDAAHARSWCAPSTEAIEKRTRHAKAFARSC